MRRALLIALAIALPHRAHAQAPAVPACASLTPKPIYMQVGDTQTNLMRRLGRVLRDNTPNPMTMVFITSGSCTNITATYAHAKIGAGKMFQYIPSKAEVADADWTPALTPQMCTVPAEGVTIDIGNSALFNSACTDAAVPATVHAEQGPIQAYVLAVPTASSQLAITLEEAYFVFGFGMAGMIAPWIDEAQIFTRVSTTSTLLAWANNLGIPADKWKASEAQASSQAVVDKINAGTAAAIGLLGAEVYDSNRATMHSLAYRAKGQYAAYYPDSTASARDKQNVRDGHYTVWSPTVWMDAIDPDSKEPLVAETRYIIDLIAGKTVTPAPNFDMISLIAATGLVPDCAMGVNRTREGGELTLYRPSESCVCKYESLVSPTATACAACSETVACVGTAVCRNRLCEDH